MVSSRVIEWLIDEDSVKMLIKKKIELVGYYNELVLERESSLENNHYEVKMWLLVRRNKVVDTIKKRLERENILEQLSQLRLDHEQTNNSSLAMTLTHSSETRATASLTFESLLHDLMNATHEFSQTAKLGKCLSGQDHPLNELFAGSHSDSHFDSKAPHCAQEEHEINIDPTTSRGDAEPARKRVKVEHQSNSESQRSLTSMKTTAVVDSDGDVSMKMAEEEDSNLVKKEDKPSFEDIPLACSIEGRVSRSKSAKSPKNSPYFPFSEDEDLRSLRSSFGLTRSPLQSSSSSTPLPFSTASPISDASYPARQPLSPLKNSFSFSSSSTSSFNTSSPLSIASPYNSTSTKALARRSPAEIEQNRLKALKIRAEKRKAEEQANQERNEEEKRRTKDEQKQKVMEETKTTEKEFYWEFTWWEPAQQWWYNKSHTSHEFEVVRDTQRAQQRKRFNWVPESEVKPKWYKK